MSRETSQNVCPICRQPAADRVENKSFPFCSNRCRLVDLGQWLDEAYRLPVRVTDRNLPDPDTLQ